MRGSNKTFLVALAVPLLLVAASCTNDSLDDGGSADVIMEIQALDAPAVTAQRSTSTTGTCSVSGNLCSDNSDCGLNETCLRTDICVLEVREWAAVIQAAAKNSMATGPFNDIILRSVDISYAWLDTAIFTPNRNVGLANIAVPADGSASVLFFPISSTDLSANPAIEGSTANLTLTFNAVTVEGTSIRQTALAQLQVEVCN